MEKILVPIFLISTVTATVAIQPDTSNTADDLDMSNIIDINDKKQHSGSHFLSKNKLYIGIHFLHLHHYV